MTWARFDDVTLDHAKVLALSDPAFRLWINSIIWCAKHETDGRLPLVAAKALTRTLQTEGAPFDELAAELLRQQPGFSAGLWERDGDDLRVHDFLEYHPTREASAHRRAVRSRSGRKGGRKTAEVRRRRSSAGSSTEADASAGAQASASASASSKPEPRPDPSRPPAPSEQGGSEGAAPALGAGGAAPPQHDPASASHIREWLKEHRG